MQVFVAQLYIEPGTSYDFSHHFQKFISQELTKRITPSDAFVERYGGDFGLVFRMSAKTGITRPEVRGPTVFKRTRDVEYTIFLTFDELDVNQQDHYRRVLRELLDEIIDVLERLQMDVSRVSRDSDYLIEQIVADPKMTGST